MVTEGDIGWCSGLFEGEGTFVFTGGHLEFKINQIEREILDRFASITGAGKVLGPYDNGIKGRKIHIYSLHTYREIMAIMKLMWPYLSEKRKAQTEATLDKFLAHKLAIIEKNKFCRKGIHPKTQKGGCNPCNKITAKAWRDAKKKQDEESM